MGDGRIKQDPVGGGAEGSAYEIPGGSGGRVRLLRLAGGRWWAVHAASVSASCRKIEDLGIDLAANADVCPPEPRKDNCDDCDTCRTSSPGGASIGGAPAVAWPPGIELRYAGGQHRWGSPASPARRPTPRGWAGAGRTRSAIA